MPYALPVAACSTPLRRLVPCAPLVVTALLAATSAVPASARPAAEPWDGPAFTADPAALVRAAAALQGAGDGGVDVLLLETAYSYDEAGRETYTQRMVYRFTEGAAHESWSAVEQPWAPWHQERPRLRARVVTPDGTEHRLDPATVTESAESASAADMFEDGRVLRAPLPATGPGAVVEEEVTVRETSPFFDGGTVEFVSFQMSVPVRRVRLVLDAPAALPLRWTARQLPGVVPAEEIAGGRRRLTFETRGLEGYEEEEPGLPPEVPRMAYVAFSTGRSWGDLAQRYSEVVDRAIRGADLATFLRDSLRAAGNSSGSQLDTINALLAKMGREIRYTGIELGEGGLLPRTPAETLKRKFGDCKDKAVLLTALLRALDIPAYVALLNAGEGDPDVEESLPGMGAFNHAIVMVPGSPAVWIDPTDPFSRAGELPVQDQGRLALVASPTATGLVRTPEATSADNREVETREIYLSDLGGARVVETTEYWGAQEQELRASYSGADRQELRDALEDYVGEAYLARKLTSLDFSDPKDLSHPFRLRLEAADASRGTTDVRDAAVALFLSAFAERLPEELSAAADEEDEEEEDGGTPAPRRNDYVFMRPLQLEQRYRIVPPAGFAPRPLPAGRTRQLGPARLEESYAASPDGAVTATLRFDTGKRRISPAELAALRDALRQLSEEKPVMITFDQSGESLLAAGRVREALDEFRRLAALSPKKALPRTRIARALLAGGLGEPARREAEQAVKLEPGLAYAWVTLGWIRQHDDLGRRFGKGYDRAGAIAAYRKAEELDAENKEARADLAILLEHDAQGDRYTAGADLPGAIAEYEALRDDLEGLGLPNNLLIAYMWAERFDDMKALLDRMETSDARAALRLVALAASEGPDAALRSAERTFADSGARAEALSTAGRNLMLLRRYGEAAALFEAAGRQSSNAGALLGLSELLRKARRSEEAAFTAKDPAGAVKRLMALVAMGKTGPETLSPLLSRELTRGLPEDQRKAFWEGFANGLGTAARAARSADLPFQVAMDLGLAVIRESVTGDDALGYRVVMTAAMGGNSQRSAAYLVPEDGEYRIAATDKAPTLLGAEALRRLAANDLRGARQWLDWAWEELDRRDASDPMSDPPFLSLWSKSSEADAGQVRCAAATIAPGFRRLEEVLPVLTACRQSAAEEARRTAFDRAILESYQMRASFAEAADAAARLLESHPDSRYLYTARAASLTMLRRWDDLRRLAEQRLARTPDDSLATDTLAEAILNQGDLDGAFQVLQRAVDTGSAGSGTYNEAAWLLLFQGKSDDRTLELAQRAAALSEYKSYPILHTLASVYAEQGKTAEAYRLVLQALEVKDADPDTSDWYVFGRLAEQYGLPDVARRYYEKARGTAGVELPPASSLDLVRRRLEALGADGAAPKQVAAGSTRR